MESGTRFRNDTSTNSNPPEKPRKEGNRDAFDELWWPLIHSTLGLRPLHMWDVGRRAHIQEGQRVLEVRAGHPLWRIYSGRVGNTGTFIALDINETINRRSRRIIQFLNLGKEKQSEQTITADENNLPFRDESMDIIIANGVETGESAYKEAFRVLKPKGRLISSEWGNYPSRLLGTDILSRIGFTNVHRRIGTPAGILIVPNMFVIASKPPSEDA